MLLEAFDPINAGAFMKTLSAFRDGGVEFMFLFSNEAALALRDGIIDHGLFLQLLRIYTWSLRRLGVVQAVAWILRRAGASPEAPCFTVVIRANPENVARFNSAWASLSYVQLPDDPPTLRWTFITMASYKGVWLESLWDRKRLFGKIDGYAFYEAPAMLGFSKS